VFFLDLETNSRDEEKVEEPVKEEENQSTEDDNTADNR
jgi:hypothetical protein